MNDQIKCWKCGHLNRPQARFCGQCGAPLGQTGESQPGQPDPTPNLPPRVADMHWRRRPGEIAARIEAKDLPGDSRGSLIIDDGVAGVILRDGEVVGQPGPGRHQLTATFERWFGRGGGQRTTALLVDTGAHSLEFDLEGLWTLDPLRLSARCRLAVQVKDPIRFARRVLKDNATFAERDLRSLLFPELRDAAQVYLSEQSMEQLDGALATRSEEFGVDVRERLAALFAEAGLEFLRVEIFDVRHPRFDAIKQQEEDLFLGPAELHNKQRLFDLYSEEQLHAIAAEETEVAHFELRSQVWERMRRAVQQDRINETTSQQELDAFMAGVERQKLLAEDELAQMRQALQWQGEDRQHARAQALALAQLQNEYALKAIQINEQFKHDQAKLHNELALAREETLGRLDIRRQQVELELDRQAREAAHRRSQQELDDLAEREQALSAHQTGLEMALRTARNQAEIARLRIEIERAEDDNDLLTAEKAQAMMRRNREAKLRIEYEAWFRQKKSELDLEERQVMLRLRERAQAHQEEMERMRTVGALSIEGQIIFAGDIERAGLLADLARTRELKGLSEEQILALLAEKQPQVIEAIKVRYQAAADGKLSAAEAEKWKALAEAVQAHQQELREQMKDAMDRQERHSREEADRQERLANEAMRNVSDVAKSFAQRPEGGQTIVLGPGGATTLGGGAVAQGGASGEVQICPDCHVRVPVGKKFCDNCGHQFF